ncbi:MAG: MopE-related protein [Polyangiales bacterium]
MKHGVLLLCAGLFGGACGGGSKAISVESDAGVVEQDAGSGPSVLASRTAAIVSAPPRYALSGESYRYRPTANGTLSSLTIEEGPPSLRARDGLLEWEPPSDQAGTHRVTLRGTTALGEATQTFNLDVAASTPRARGQISASAGGSVVAAGVESPLWRGVGVSIPRGALSGNVEITVSELDRAPAMPSARGGLRPARFEPAGTVFATPAQAMLPLPANMQGGASRLRAYVYDPSGRWERVPVVAVDPDSNLLIARVSHFSVYAAVEPELDLTTTLAPAPAASACAGALLARASLDVPASTLRLASVNNLSPGMRAQIDAEDGSLRDLLALPGLRGSVRAVQVFTLHEPGSEVVAEEEIAVTTLLAPGDGTLTVTHSDGLGNPSGRETFRDPVAGMSEIEARLLGRATTVRLAAGAGERTLTVRTHLAYADGDASSEPVDTRDLGLAAVESDPVPVGAAPADLSDRDCDGLLDAFDDVDDSLVPTLDVAPRAVVRAFPGESVTLRARVSGEASSDGEWRVLDGANTKLEPVAEGRAFSASDGGRYLVGYRATRGATLLEHVFAIDVVRPPATNTPPRCLPSRASEGARVGDALDVLAVASDAESEPGSLRVEWGLFDAASGGLTATPQLAATGARARLVPTQAGTYVVGCRAFDGQLEGAVSTLELSVAALAENRPPDLTVSPKEIGVIPGTSVTVRAWATDLDRDALTSTWTVDGKAATPVGTGSETRLVVPTGAVGTITVGVEATDGKATSRGTALIHVREPVPSPVDADRDSFFAGTTPQSDCNDGDPSVYPGAAERCNKVDDDCDGQIDDGACGGGEVDACVANTNGGCDPLTRCMTVPGGRTCTSCPLGYSGTGEAGCKDIDECARKDACDPTSTCRNVPGGFECGGCPTGYIGTGATGCVDIDECATRASGCDPLVKCTNTPGSFECGGCPNGYEATAAKGCVDVNECATNNGGCAANALCTNTPGSFTCGGCPAGYTGTTGACVDIDECLTRNGGCDPLTKCANTDGARTCGACPAGYTGTGDTRCEDVDECKSPTAQVCTSGQVCTNTTGSFTCGCGKGFVLDGESCSDVDECAAPNNPCTNGAFCTNTVGSYACGCPQGTFDESGDGTRCSTIARLMAGYEKTCLLTTGGSVYCWGSGQASVARQNLGAAVTDYAWGGATCFIAGGRLYCQGANSFGEVGTGNLAQVTAPQQVGTDSDWRAVAAGSRHTCGLRGERIFCWGSNSAGQLAVSESTTLRPRPGQIGSESDWSQLFGASNEVHDVCGIRNGQAYCWGFNDYGQTGSAPINAQRDVLQIGKETGWSKLALAYGHSCGIRDGGLYCWGLNNEGQVGIGSEAFTSPIARIGNDADWIDVSASSTMSCAIREKSLWCWGRNGYLSSSRVPTPVEGTGWSQVSCGYTHACGVRNGLLYCWGQNNSGQLGNGTNEDSLEPVPVTMPKR